MSRYEHSNKASGPHKSRLIVSFSSCILFTKRKIYTLHAWQSHTQQLGTVLYLVVQIYEHLHRQTFQAILQCTSALQVFTFSCLLPDNFLRLLPGTVKVGPDNRTLEICQVGYATFNELNSGTPKIIAAVERREDNTGRGIVATIYCPEARLMYKSEQKFSFSKWPYARFYPNKN